MSIRRHHACFSDDYGDMSWCDCWHTKSLKRIGDVLECHCGEELKRYDWVWENTEKECRNNVKIINKNRDVLFNPVYSSGTAVARGEKILQNNLQYYWEIKMLTSLYGTDIMVGVGTPKVQISDWKLRFCSMLGFDRESWGYSYHGWVHHNSTFRTYGHHFTAGSLVGVYVDMWTGTLEFFLNRKSLGIAFRGLRGVALYPMVCSTACQSGMRITCAITEPSTLQLMCLRQICENEKLSTEYAKIPGLVKLMKKKYFWLEPKQPERKLKTMGNKRKCREENCPEDRYVIRTHCIHDLRTNVNFRHHQNETDGSEE